MFRPTPIILIPIRFPLVGRGQNLNEVVLDAFARERLRLKRGDVLAVASKVVSLCENQIINLDVKVSAKARRYSQKWRIDSRLVEIVLREADEILGGVRGFLLTVKSGILTANAGVDLKNSPPGTATLWPANPDATAQRLQRYLRRRTSVRIGVEIVDSRVTALRLGTTGLAIGTAGFDPIHDDRGKPDLYGRKIRVTQMNIADSLAAAANMLMCERKQRIGAVLIRGAQVNLANHLGSNHLRLKRQQCLIVSNMRLPGSD